MNARWQSDISDLKGMLYQKFIFNRHRYYGNVAGIKNLLSFTPREQMLDHAMDFIKNNGVKGDYLEFGVFFGQTFSAAFHLSQWHKLDMRFFAFDSFEGLPEIHGIDAVGYGWKKGEYACDLKTFIENLKRWKVDLNKIETIKGWYDDTLTAETKMVHDISRAAVIWVDCDLYESTIPVLDFLTGIIQDGSVIIFDDWFSYRANKNMGEQKAFRQWLRRNPDITPVEFLNMGWHGKSFILTV